LETEAAKRIDARRMWRAWVTYDRSMSGFLFPAAFSRNVITSSVERIDWSSYESLCAEEKRKAYRVLLSLMGGRIIFAFRIIG